MKSVMLVLLACSVLVGQCAIADVLENPERSVAVAIDSGRPGVSRDAKASAPHDADASVPHDADASVSHDAKASVSHDAKASHPHDAKASHPHDADASVSDNAQNATQSDNDRNDAVRSADKADNADQSKTGLAGAAFQPGKQPVSARPKLAIGFNVDLLPIVMSAITREFGMAGQVWFGVDHVRLRMVGARTFMPDFMMSGGFTRQDTTVAALLVDYCFGDHFDKWWIGTGFELWFNKVEHKTETGTAEWSNVVWTVGGGYIWRFWKNMFLDPWVAVHVPLNNQSVTIGGSSFTPWPVSAEISLKIGWFFDF